MDVRLVAITTMLLLFAAACSDDDDPGVDAGDVGDVSLSDVDPDDADATSDADAEGPAEPSCELRLADENGEVFDTLSEFCFFGDDTAAHEPVDGVVPYTVTAELYSDLSRKKRFIVIPDGETIGFDATEPWSWPDDSILIKTFYYPVDATDPDSGRQILETRLLHKRNGEWEADSYVWDDDQEDAELHNFGRRVDVTFIDEEGESVEIDYRIPNRNQCTTCHGQDGDLSPLGPRTRQLLSPYEPGGENPTQIENLMGRNLFDEPPADVDELFGVADPYDESESLDDRARAYLDANCAHCHNPDGRASSSNLYLGVDIVNPNRLGICKTPVAAGSGSGGHSFDIVPGEPDESILVFRMETTDASIKMPELPITTNDEFGIELVRQWIAAMDPQDCD